MSKETITHLLGPVSLLLMLAACGPQPLDITQEPVTLHLVACDTCSALVQELATAYQSEYPWVTLEVETFNTAVVEAQLRSRAADLFALPQTEATQLPPWSAPFATNAVIIVVHPTVPIESLDIAQLREIFRGRIGEWEDGTPIQVVSREAGAGTRTVLETQVMEGQDVVLTAVVMPGDQEVLDFVAATPGAIGYVSLGQLSDEVRTLAINSIYPASNNLNTYPLSFPLHLGTPSEPEGATRSFIQWALSPEGQQRVDQLLRDGLVPP